MPKKGKSRPKEETLAEAIVPRLVPAPARDVAARLGELKEAAAEAGVADALSALLATRAELPKLVGSVLDCSSFLRSLILADPRRFLDFMNAPPQAVADAILARIARGGFADEAALMTALRVARYETALVVALADLGGIWDVVAVTGALTAFANTAVGAAARFILSDAQASGSLIPPDPTRPEEGSGWIILGMGKFGAGELNYSSDIDLIVLYDPAVAKVADDKEPLPLFIRMTKRLVHILHEHTADGYVFRTDLRLRPDPGATNIVMSTEAALQYYESLGQNWERAALIKARPVAADIAAGNAFLAELVPYIWRKYLDYAAIADIHSIKRQIHDHRGHEEIAVAGHNIKLGRGGIREIEFFVQTQQLIAGGRNPELRGRRTLDVLAELAAFSWIDKNTAASLAKAYVALRAIEHCLQMVADEQTHTLPEDDAALAVIARMAGYRTAAAFSKALLKTQATVRDGYAGLFEAAPSLTSDLGSLVFTGDTDDPDTLATLSRLGYQRPAEVTRAVRTWHFGRYPAMRSAAARERLTEFVPALLETLARTENADASLLAFDRFLARLPAGVQLFSLLTSNPGLLSLLVTMMSTAPRLSDIVGSHPHVLDALIDPAFYGRLPSRETLDERLGESLGQAVSYEDLLDRARLFKQEISFLIGGRVLAGTIGPRQAGTAYATLADRLIAALLEAARREFEAAHGRIKGGQIAVVAMGKLGGREMTAASDLDLIVLYDFDERASASGGARPLPGGLDFARLTQRVLAALSAQTTEGALYDVDFRLRPSGKSGPVASHIESFVLYQEKEAWTWEHMALTRARLVAGDAALVARAEKEIARLIRRRRDAVKLRADVLEMRAMVEKEKGGEGTWDLKQVPGGLVDIEFVAQWLQLAHAAADSALVSTETDAVLTAAVKARLLPQKEADVLLPALRLYQALTQVLRLCVKGTFEPADAPRGLLDMLSRAGEMPDFATLDAHLRETEAAVRAAFERLIGKVVV